MERVPAQAGQDNETLSCLLDANVVSELTRDRSEPRVIAFLSEQPDLWIFTLVLHELEYGLELLPHGARRDGLEAVFTAFVAEYGESILPLDRMAARWAGRFRAGSHRSGRVLDLGDALIAGTARAHELSLATRNVRDFDRLDLEVTNPWGA